MKKVMAFGTFDIIHPGHIFFLTEAKKLGEYLVVVVGRDETVCEVKARCPDHDEATRCHNVTKLKIADEVRLGSTTDKYQVIREVKPDIITLGYDQTFFTEGLPDAISSHTTIVRLPALKPEIYKSSKLRA